MFAFLLLVSEKHLSSPVSLPALCVGLDAVCDGNLCCKGFSWSLGRIIPCPHDAFRSVVGWPKMPGIMVGMDQKDSCVDEEAHVLTMKYPIDHTDNDSGMYKAEVAGNDALDAVLRSIVGGYNMPCIMVGMDQKDSNYDTSRLSEDLVLLATTPLSRIPSSTPFGMRVCEVGGINLPFFC